MKFAKIIFCGDEKIEITANTYTAIDIAQGDNEYDKKKFLEDRLNKFDVVEFMKTYGNIPDILKIVKGVDIPVVEIPFQVNFWRSFCSVLVKSAGLGYLRWLGCLSKVCKNDCKEIKDIKIEDNDHIVVKARYGIVGCKDISLVYPYDYLELLEVVDRGIVIDGALTMLTMRNRGEKKTPVLSKREQMISDFFIANEKAIKQFKKYASELKKKKFQKEKAKEIYRDLLVEGSLIVDGKGFSEKYCGFDIYKKKEEIDAIVKKLKDSNDAGEVEVEYAIKWLCAESTHPFQAIKKNCETKYRYGCILLKNSSFIDEPQEYDHILVSDIGIIAIETKHWKGRAVIHSDGKWLRDPNNEGCLKGIKSPLYQIQRHESLLKSIFPNVPIYNLLVFSNPSLILEGVENCNMCHVIYVDKLKETVMNILSSSEPSVGAIGYYVNEIEKYKINIMGDDIRELKQ